MLQLKIHTDKLECGTDEAGRGCLAGPVTAAAVILPDDFVNTLLNDSKQLSLLKRNNLKPLIEKEAVAYSVTHVMMEEIDKTNILQASITGMHRSVSSLKIQPEFIAVDGNKFRPFHNIPHQCVVKGDAKFLHIAAASVLAKTYRDAFMEKIHYEYPMYNWKQNKGYPTKEHREAILKYGITKYHRMSFRLSPNQLTLNLI